MDHPALTKSRWSLILESLLGRMAAEKLLFLHSWGPISWSVDDHGSVCVFCIGKATHQNDETNYKRNEFRWMICCKYLTPIFHDCQVRISQLYILPHQFLMVTSDRSSWRSGLRQAIVESKLCTAAGKAFNARRATPWAGLQGGLLWPLGGPKGIRSWAIRLVQSSYMDLIWYDMIWYKYDMIATRGITWYLECSLDRPTWSFLSDWSSCPLADGISQSFSARIHQAFSPLSLEIIFHLLRISLYTIIYNIIYTYDITYNDDSTNDM